MRVAADVFSPCALGAILDEQSIAGLDAAVVAGAANNQLATPADGERLLSKGILYAPDYVINAGSIINVATEYLGQGDAESVRGKLAQLHERLTAIFAQRSEARRGGKGGVRTCSSRWSPSH